MLGWRDLQISLANSVLTGDFSGLAPYVREDGMSVESRIKVYRNNVVTSLTSLLAERFLVVERLVGAGFFAFAAENFIARTPPDQPCLDAYGAGFSEFLAEFPACSELPYLADVAALEWKLFAVARAPFAPPVGIEILAGIDAERAMNLRLRCDPPIEYLASAWPVDQIWRAHQGDVSEIMISPGTSLLELRRRDGQLTIRELDPAAFAFRNRLAAGATLAEAVTAALGQTAAFDFPVALAELFQEQWVTEATYQEETQ